MNVTPTDKQLDSMKRITDALCGDMPSVLEVSPGAQARRIKRALCMDVLHQLVAVSMREGANRIILEARQRAEGMKPIDVQDRSAVDQAKDDAAAGSVRVKLT